MPQAAEHRPPKLLDRVRAAIRARHYSRATERAYVRWIRQFVLTSGKRHPAETGAQEITRFLTSLAVDRRVAPSTQNQALSAILFLYREVFVLELPWLDNVVRAKPSHHVPVVLLRAEARAVLERMTGSPAVMAALLYGSGLRLLECCRLRVQDVDFTLPHALNDLARRRPRVVFDALFGAASATLLTFASDPRHLGARPGITTVLHTWTQRLDLHIHLHCIVTAGGLDPTARQWVKCPRGFLFSVRALSRVFRGKYLDALRRLQDAPIDAELQTELYRHDWVVYAKAPPAGPAALLDYLARYTHRVAIGNERILRLHGRTVFLRWRDSAHRNKKRVLHIDAVEFLSRFVQHVLPRGFKRVRHYGLLAPAAKADALAACRRYFGVVGSSSALAPLTVATLTVRLGRDIERCEACGSRSLRIEPAPAVALLGHPRGPP